VTGFATAAGAFREGAEGYTRALLDLLGDQDPIEVQSAQIPVLHRLVEGIRPELLSRPEAEGRWSIVEVVQHLADTEVVYAYRVRMVLSHDTPEIQPFDQELWARRLRYRERTLAESIEQLTSLRIVNLSLYLSLTPEELARCGVHPERGAESVWQMIRLAAAHDLAHRRQIERIRSAIGLEAAPHPG
jgi:uncharacterized damage-inducible protein DinB